MEILSHCRATTDPVLVPPDVDSDREDEDSDEDDDRNESESQMRSSIQTGPTPATFRLPPNLPSRLGVFTRKSSVTQSKKFLFLQMLSSRAMSRSWPRRMICHCHPSLFVEQMNSSSSARCSRCVSQEGAANRLRCHGYQMVRVGEWHQHHAEDSGISSGLSCGLHEKPACEASFKECSSCHRSAHWPE